MIRRIIAWLAKLAGLSVVAKNATVDDDPDGGFYDWYWRLP